MKKLTKEEQQIENDLVKGVYVPASKDLEEAVAKALASRKKDAVLNVRVNSTDLKRIKQKAKKLGVKYHTFISEMIHQIAR